MRPLSRIVLAGIVAWAAFGAAISGCQSLECGANTIEKDGKCVASPTQPNRECGPGTTFDSDSGRCVSDLFEQGGGICGRNTVIEVNDAGVHFCVGTGSGSGDCNDPLPCPAPTAARGVSMCGRIYDLEDSRPLDDGVESNGEPWKTIEVRAIDPLAFIPNPNAPPIARVLPDSCGRYALLNVVLPDAGFIAVTTEDVTGASEDLFVQTGIADALGVGQVVPGQRAWVLRRTTDQTWSTAAGFGSGQTFGKMGVYIPIFISGVALAPFPASPTSDVKTTIDQGTGTRMVKPLQDFYFGDSDPLVRRNLVPARDMTGANGTGLYIMQPSLDTFSGIGNSPGGTCWAKNFAAAPVGAAFVQERTAEAQFCP